MALLAIAVVVVGKLLKVSDTPRRSF